MGWVVLSSAVGDKPGEHIYIQVSHIGCIEPDYGAGTRLMIDGVKIRVREEPAEVWDLTRGATE